ncbi:sortase A [Hathewaya proteolytica DSM 3090]|uniref:Sortase A n=1 Tax=Hathewaya proteolytica DSM 3090 TaxID=1121331 RepID=A0A1M6MHM5_9CLOT|nr:class C sortase [Hathewaya proteolytica]SHJ82982.1 sortase A [Hathewaya proteolytica DSM 3090]
MIKKHISTIILVFVFLLGLGLLLYPTVSDLWNKYRQSKAIADYEDKVHHISKEDYSKILTKAQSYNQRVSSNEFPATEEEVMGGKEYNDILNLNGSGMMGYIKIDKIDVRLAIYHGIGEPVLQAGVGHMPWTSLPVGGNSTHAVLSGHRGLPSAKLFSDLDKMKIGDIFYIYVLDQVLAYEVDQIKTVEPTDTEELKIVQGKDYMTLVTCTPYGINTHRLLIRGTRVPYEKTIAEKTSAGRDATVIAPVNVAAAIAIPIIMVIVLIFLIRKRMHIMRARKGDEDNL